MPQTQLFSFQSQILLNARSMIRFDSMESTDPEVPFCKRDGIPDKSRGLSGLESLNNCPSMKSQLLLLLYFFSSQRHSLTMVHYMGHCDRKFFISSNLTDRWLEAIWFNSKVRLIKNYCLNSSNDNLKHFLLPIPCAHFCFCPQMAWLGFFHYKFFLPPHAATGNQTHGRVAPPQETF